MGIKEARGRQDRDEELCWRLEVNGEILFFKRKETNFLVYKLYIRQKKSSNTIYEIFKNYYQFDLDVDCCFSII